MDAFRDRVYALCMSRFRFSLALVTAFGCAALQAQQDFEPLTLGPLTFSGSVRDRVENWDWFTPTAGEHAYTFNGTTIRFGLTRNLTPFDWIVELEAPILLNLPANAVASGAQGQLGLGASYYVANDKSRNAAMLFPKQLNLRFHNLFGNSFSTLKLGRFDFADGMEVAAKDPTLAAIKRDRVQQRLIGTFVFSDVLRGFDGFHFVYNKPKINYTWVAAVPTRGVFQVDGWGWLDTAFSYASATGQLERHSNRGEWRAFAIYYDDWRDVAKVDNRSTAAKAADHGNIRIFTYGGHYLNVTKTRAGSIDLMAEGALQTGDWGTQTQRAGMFDVEGGYQPKILPGLKPWLRAGFYYGSGDKNPGDNKHGTFFEILPTPRLYARMPFYNLENIEDRFAMLTLHPWSRFTFHNEVHSLRLASSSDLWYTGGGAFQPFTFGYQGRPVGGVTSLANLYDVNVDMALNNHIVLTPYLGYAAGKSVIEAIYPKGRDGHLAFLEFNYKF
jgi:hypothetical protein